MKFLHWEIIQEGSFYNKEHYNNILSDPESEVGKRLNFFIMFCVVVGVGIIIFESVPIIRSTFGYQVFLLDILVSTVFSLEYVYKFLRSDNKLRFPTNIFNIIDLLSFLPFFLGLVFQIVAGFDFLKILRLLRVLRLFEVSSQSPIVLGFIHTIRSYRHEYKAVFSIFVTMLIIVSTFVYYAEVGVNPDFSSIPASLWWGMVTMTTVGYGDMSPITTYGKLLGSILILLGPVLVAVMGSITILVFMDVSEAHKGFQTKSCTHCKMVNRKDARFCYHCGKQTFIELEIEGDPHSGSHLKKLFSKR